MLGDARFGTLQLTLPDGSVRSFGGEPGPSASLEIRCWGVMRNLAVGGDVAFAEDYRSGKWDSPDISAVVLWSLRNEDRIGPLVHGGRMRRWLSRLLYAFRRNTRGGSSRNIRSHYDLGNDFYELWLDPSMTYSSAIFRDGSEGLADGQRNKHDRILGLLGDSGQDLLEIGCGWGGFAERAVREGGHRVTGVTISPAQHAYAARRLEGERAAKIRLQDYRDVPGRYSSVVSIEMFEAVGERYWGTFFSKLGSALASGGKAVIQTIVMDDAHYDRYRKGGDAIRSLIFPGGMLPSDSAFRCEAARAGLETVGSHAFGADYAKTLRLWLERFEARRDDLLARGYDERLLRLWRYYLSCCIGAFAAGRTDVVQFELAHG